MNKVIYAHHYASLFYAFLFFSAYRLSEKLFLLPIEHPLLSPSTAMLLCLLVTGASIVKNPLYMRLGSAIFISLILALLFSAGKIFHGNHLWIISSLAMCFFSPKAPAFKGKNLLVIRSIQSIILSHYLISGIWKLRSLNMNFDAGSQAIAYSLAEGHGPLPFLTPLIENHFWVLDFGWWVILCFQLSTIIPIISGRNFLAWGILAVIFHFITGITLGIWFTPTVSGVIFFLILTELFIKSNNPDTHEHLQTLQK